MRFADLIEAAGSDNGGLIPEGEYTLEVDGVNTKPAKSGPALGILWKVLDRGPVQGMTSWQNLYFSEKAAARSIRELGNIIGADELAAIAGDLDAQDAVEAVGKALKGRQVNSTVDIEEGTGGYKDKNTFRNTPIELLEKPARATKAAPKPTFELDGEEPF